MQNIKGRYQSGHHDRTSTHPLSNIVSKCESCLRTPLDYSLSFSTQNLEVVSPYCGHKNSLSGTTCQKKPMSCSQSSIDGKLDSAEVGRFMLVTQDAVAHHLIACCHIISNSNCRSSCEQKQARIKKWTDSESTSRPSSET